MTFDAASDKAIVVIGTNVTRAQEEISAGRSLETYWQEYSPESQHLVPGGRSFLTRIGGSVFSEPEYLKPTVSVLVVDPGAYALIAAGFPHQMTSYVRSKNNGGDVKTWHRSVDPRYHIDPEAPVDQRGNFLFSILPGQILYIGHFEFKKWEYIDRLISINYYQDKTAAHKALQEFPGISGEMLIFDPARPPQSAAR